ncbi:glycoside hydrolase family 3 C-terminal domain-containing protein [Glycomyces sp. TRM65418]|uniref:glycoside hydrolase family 3 protein n=1 Tax=Glycomyces sp. TRM65418 TaxID=2867006 RepID=UPI001CE5FC6A|nr:glycoside hydrolase family 3 C-terminal domain-containing protein [Glycomyces sp. TRM65418]MCC3762314.1 glycoside hydrolase family 3 C-terminal domain-containing protein [Glycomyces sp. TRM65418]QZD56368.1 glycoside hydrolase family 3 C-terminal domain-containing protein [Glycomyces sp. TRM65418]
MSAWTLPADRPEYDEAVEAALGRLSLETKADLLAGIDMWRTLAVPEAGLRSMTVSDGPIGVRGRFWTAADPSLALPSPTAQAASWDPVLVRRIGNLLADEARRKDVDVLLAPTVNLHRSPLGGRHFEAFSEDPYLTGRIAQAYVAGVQERGVATTMKHYVGNDAETDRFTVDNVIGERALRELYLRPFEMITAAARPWGVMTAYNAVNGRTMTAHRELMSILRDEFGFDGFNVSDWAAARHTVEDIEAGLDLAMPGPYTVYGGHLVEAVRDGRAAESDVDDAVRRMLKLAARVGALEGVEAAVDTRPAPIEHPEALLREIARRSFVLAKNDPPAGDEAAILPLHADAVHRLALIGPAAAEARVLGGGSATVFPKQVVAPLDGLREALGDRVAYAQGVDLFEQILPAAAGFELTVRPVRVDGAELPAEPLANGDVKWMGYLPGDLAQDDFHHALLEGVFTVTETGEHVFGTRGLGHHRLVVGDEVLFEGDQPVAGDDPFEAFFGPGVEQARVHLEAGQRVPVRLEYAPSAFPPGFPPSVLFGLMHTAPRPDEDRLIAEAVEAARAAEVAVVVVSTTDLTESEGFDRRDLRLPGRQDELVAAVAAANPNTIVVVNTGSPVEMPWADDVAAILLTWFPGQEGGHALADVLLGAEPGGRLTTTWPKRLDDAPVVQVAPNERGELHYEEGVFIGYRAWERHDAEPAYWFGHGLSYTDWEYVSLTAEADSVRVRVRNRGARAGREVVQVYLSPEQPDVDMERHRLAGFASVGAEPGETVDVVVPLEARSFQVWDEERRAWAAVSGTWTVAAGRSVGDLRLEADVKRA